jgi:DEAD/DEAH box helicase domain-containing protein
MQDPIGSFYTIRDNFITYIKTAFGTRFPGIEQQREALLKRPGTLYQRPWIEPMPQYEKGKPILLEDEGGDSLVLKDLEVNGALPDGFNDDVFKKFKKLARAGLVGNYELHSHQQEMLQRGLNGENLVVTAGTGSGKTEAFLLPVLAHLVLESESWPKGNGSHPPTRWWDDTAHKNSCRNDPGNENSRFNRSWFVPKKSAGSKDGREPAVRALIIYPMNALVEDQMTRLRKALDSKETRDWYRKEFGPCDESDAGSPSRECFYFGRYTGTTPVPGRKNKTMPDGSDGGFDRMRIDNLEKAFKEIDECCKGAKKHDDKENKGKEEVRFFFPSLDGAEMCSRWDMHEFPPDILVTNFSMLSIMMMRDVDKDIIQKTREWLANDRWHTEKDGQPERVFHLVIDELHLYRGTAGTEVAYLIRLLLYRLGLEPNSPQLQILASSASLDAEGENADKSKKFLHDFFGATGEREVKIIPGAPPEVSGSDAKLPPAPFIELAKSFDDISGDKLEAYEFDQQLEEKYRAIGEALENTIELPFKPDDSSDHPNLAAVLTQLAYENFSNLLLNAFRENRQSEFRAQDSLELGKRLFDCAGIDDENIEDVIVRKALRGLLILRGRAEFAKNKDNKTPLLNKENKMPLPKKDTLPSLRMHWFFRNLEGLWASPDPADMPSGASKGGSPVGQVVETPEALITQKGNRLLELLYCEQCGAAFLGGAKREIMDLAGACTSWELLANDTDIEGIPDRKTTMLSQQRKYDEYGMFWPNGELPLAEEASHWNTDGRQAEWVEATLDPARGEVKAGNHGGVKGYLFHFDNLDTSARHNANNQDRAEARKNLLAFPAMCPCCGEDCRKKKRKKSPIRTFRTGFTKVSQTFAKELFYQLPTTEEDDRKLVVFSDSREDAARIANDIERFHYSDMVRDALYGELIQNQWGRASLAQALLDNHAEDQWGDLARHFKDYFPHQAKELIDAEAEWSVVRQGIEKLDEGVQETVRNGNSHYLVLKQASALLSSRTFELGKLFAEQLRDGGPNSHPLLIQKLKNIGINPAGISPKQAFFKADNNAHDWWEWFDYSNPRECFRGLLAPAWKKAFNEEEERQSGRRDPQTGNWTQQMV